MRCRQIHTQREHSIYSSNAHNSWGWAKANQVLDILFWFSTWVAGTQLHEPSPLLPRVFILKEIGVTAETQTQVL